MTDHRKVLPRMSVDTKFFDWWSNLPADEQDKITSGAAVDAAASGWAACHKAHLKVQCDAQAAAVAQLGQNVGLGPAFSGYKGAIPPSPAAQAAMNEALDKAKEAFRARQQQNAAPNSNVYVPPNYRYADVDEFRKEYIEAGGDPRGSCYPIVRTAFEAGRALKGNSITMTRTTTGKRRFFGLLPPAKIEKPKPLPRMVVYGCGVTDEIVEEYEGRRTAFVRVTYDQMCEWRRLWTAWMRDHDHEARFKFGVLLTSHAPKGFQDIPSRIEVTASQIWLTESEKA